MFRWRFTLAFALATGVTAAGVSTASRGVFVAARYFRSIDDFIAHVPLWRQRFDITGDGRFDSADVYDFLGRKGELLGGTRFHFGYDFNGDDRVNNSDINILFDLYRRFPDGYAMEPTPPPAVVAAYYPWYNDDRIWKFAASIPTRGKYQSLEPEVYLRQRLEAHAAGIDIFAVSTSPDPNEVRHFHAMQAELERTEDPALTRFLWLYELLGRLPYTLNTVGQEIVDFDDPLTRGRFVADMAELAGYFHENYLLLDEQYFPIWIWKTNTIRGDFVGTVSEARETVRQEVGKDLVIIGGELAQFPVVDAELVRRLPAFFAMSHYGIYTPRFTEQFGGMLSEAHTDFTIENLAEWIRIVREQGNTTIYGGPMRYWPPLQFGFDDRYVPGRRNPTMSASEEQLEYYIQQLDREIVTPNRDIVGILNHTSYNEHLEGHGMEPTMGYNGMRSWIRLYSVYRGPTNTYRRVIANDPKFAAEYGAIFEEATRLPLDTTSDQHRSPKSRSRMMTGAFGGSDEGAQKYRGWSRPRGAPAAGSGTVRARKRVEPIPR